ncbi:MAG: hypothetical protein ACPGJP_05065 [Hyphomicrobiales bacterium]
MASVFTSSDDAKEREKKFKASLEKEGISNFNTSDDIKEKFNFWRRILWFSILIYSILLILLLIIASSNGLSTLYQNTDNNNYDSKDYESWKITSWAGLGLGVFCLVLLFTLSNKWSNNKKYVTAAENLSGAMANVYTKGQTTKLLHSSMARLISRNDHDPEVEALRKHFENNDNDGSRSRLKYVFDQIHG